MTKDKPSDELFVKFTLPNNHFIIFNAKKLTNSEAVFELEFKSDKVFQKWLSNRIDKPSVDQSYYEPKA